jgi:3-hydroxyacyl-CoA dehydrogenase / enoyl-CoA hydratase / 3-hydroxybutyryl-CoA epimerase
MEMLAIEVGDDGVAVLTLDNPDKPMNVVSPQWIAQMNLAIDQIEADPLINGVIITSGKSSFMAGADLKAILAMMEGNISFADASEFSRSATRMHRRLETCGKPIVAAINGLALGGGYELCLACHHRIGSELKGLTFGLPEVGVGLLAGSGGTQRLPRMIGLKAALPYVVEGKVVAARQALEAGLIDQLVPPDQLMTAAREWLESSPDPLRDWDRSDYLVPSHTADEYSKSSEEYNLQAEKISRRYADNYPAPLINLNAVYEGATLAFDEALKLESKYFAQLLTSSVAKNIVRTSFVNIGRVNKLVRRPAAVDKFQFTRIGVVGGGPVGAGISYLAARAGLTVVTFAATVELATQGMEYTRRVIDKSLAPGAKPSDKADSICSRIQPSIDAKDLANCEMVIEVESGAFIKLHCADRESILEDNTILARDVSGAPISELGLSTKYPEKQIGLRFLTPVERRPLVEIVAGEFTSEETLARAFDLMGQLRMTPILINGVKGLYVSRVWRAYTQEGMYMLEEGVSPALIEQAGILAGMTQGPLADRKESLSGDSLSDRQPKVSDLIKRLLYIQAMESARCLEEGVLTDHVDGDIGSVLGWSFPPWTGGTFSYMDMEGLQHFVEGCETLSETLGPRFKPSPWLRKTATMQLGFHSELSSFN